MKLSKFLLILVTATIIALLCVQQQVEVTKISYNIRSKEERLLQLLDRHEILRYNVTALESPGNLENKLLAKNIKFEMPGRWQVVQLKETKWLNEGSKPSVFDRGKFVFLSFFTLKSKAEAITKIDTDLEHTEKNKFINRIFEN